MLWKCLHWPFCPGVFIGILAFAAAAVTFRKDPGTREKAVWIFVFLGLMCGEIWMMSLDRAASERERQEAEQQLAQQFSNISNGITHTIENSDKEFAVTMGRTNAVLTSITGGESYGVVVPMLANLAPDMEVPLAIENRGAHILTGVSVTLYDTGIWMGFTHNSILRSVGNRISVGTLHPQERLVLNTQIRPEQYMALDDAKSQFRVFVLIAAQNFTSSEYLDFKKESTNHWVYRYQIYKENTTADIRRAARRKSL